MNDRPILLSVVDQAPIPAGFTAGDALNNSIDLARACERLGYMRYWIAEHHATGSFASPAPEILMARVAAETRRMRVGSGGVLLSHYSPLKVAEVFQVLEALYPGRIDLGIGRAPGSRMLEAHALQRQRMHQPFVDDFPQQLLELLSFLGRGFREGHPFSQIDLQPRTAERPEVWLLGSSGWSADAAAKLGLPYAAAHFINPASTRESLQLYRETFRPSAELKEPRALVALGAVCAETEAEAQRLYASQRLRRLLRDRGETGPILPPHEAIERLGEAPLPVDEGSEWPRIVVGDVEQVHDTLSQLTADLDIDELMIVTVVHDHAARVRSYKLLAEAFGLLSRD